jgi:hypothetical protein
MSELDMPPPSNNLQYATTQQHTSKLNVAWHVGVTFVGNTHSVDPHRHNNEEPQPHRHNNEEPQPHRHNNEEQQPRDAQYA